MSLHWTLRKKQYYFAAIEIKGLFKELKQTDTEHIENLLRSSNLEFYEIEKVKTSVLFRFTMPLAILIGLAMFILSPVNYIVSGRWGYKNEFISNWFRKLGF